jgi:histidyl-tRNA synthetase
MELQLNSIGSSDARKAFRAALVEFLQERVDALDEDSQRRLHTNPLRILDSKNPQTQAVLDDGPSLEDYLDEEAKADFARLCELLQAAGVKYTVNRRLVRGLDYYNKTVFEWVTTKLGAQGTVCAGGRYDGLVAQLGGKATPAIGCAMGMERLVLLLIEQGVAVTTPVVDAYVLAVGGDAQCLALAATEGLRLQLPQLRIVQHTGGGSFKSQMKKADKSGARVALIWGEDEVAAQTVTVKALRASDGERAAQVTVALEDLETTLCAALAH